MVENLSCPVCSSFSIEPIMRDMELTARVDKTACSLSDFVAFSCFQGHVFLVMSHYADVVEDRVTPAQATAFPFNSGPRD
jgi:hypothetical protein